jgi:hypothetical protein
MRYIFHYTEYIFIDALILKNKNNLGEFRYLLDVKGYYFIEF